MVWGLRDLCISLSLSTYFSLCLSLLSLSLISSGGVATLTATVRVTEHLPRLLLQKEESEMRWDAARRVSLPDVLRLHVL